MGNLKFRYYITTKVKKDGDYYIVVDEIRFESGNIREIRRKKGTKLECEKFAERLAKYWQKTMSKKPDV